MIKQSILPFKLKMSKEYITTHTGLALYVEFLRAIGIKRLIEAMMPAANFKNKGGDFYRTIKIGDL